MTRALPLTAFLLAACAAAPPRPAAVAPKQEVVAATDQTTAEFEAKCEDGRLACRRDVRIRLLGRNGKPYDRSWRWFPPVLQTGFLTILPGERLLVEARIDGERLVLEGVVPEVKHPERTLVLSFMQDEGKEMMMLSIHNPFDRLLKYDARMMLLDDPEGRVLPTSSCAVMPGLRSYETWPDPIFQLILEDLRFLAPGPVRSVPCE